MKIVYIASSAIPSKSANSLHVMKMCQAFAKNNNDVTLLVPNRVNDILHGVNCVHEYYNVRNNFNVKKLPWLNIKGRGVLYGIFSALKARELKSNLVYCRNLYGAFFSILIGLTVTYEVHQPFRSKVEKILFNYMYKKENFKNLVVITNALKLRMKKDFSTLGNNILVAHDGADIIDFNVIKAKKLTPNNKLHIGYTGSLFEGKGMELIYKIVKKCDWVEFHIIGGDDNIVTQWKQKLLNYNNITFYGFLPQNELLQYMKSFDIVLLPNQEKVMIYKDDIGQWTSPLKLFEYMAASKPIIASDLVVLREVLNENNSILVPPTDINLWIEAIKTLEDKKIRDELSLQAYKDIKNKYTWFKRVGSIV